MSFLKKLFGGAPKEETVVEHGEFRIYPAPQKESSGYRIAARIEWGAGDEIKTHQMIRADTIQGEDEAIDASVSKAKQVIDQMGIRIFD